MDKVEEDNKTREKNETVEAERKEMQNQFREKVLESGIMESEGSYEAVANGIRDTARELLGAASGKREEKTERHGGGTKKYNRR